MTRVGVCAWASSTSGPTRSTSSSSTPTPARSRCPAFSHKTELRLSESLEADGRVSDATAGRLVAFIHECLEVAEDHGVGDLFAFATSALRESPNGEAVIERVRTETGRRARGPQRRRTRPA